MAEGTRRTSRRSGSGTASEAAADRQESERVILKREKVIVVPQDADREKMAEAAKLVKGQHGDAWVEVARVTARDKTTAIKRCAGEPGSPAAKPGTYKAPAASAFKGGMEYVRPDKPKVEAKPLDD